MAEPRDRNPLSTDDIARTGENEDRGPATAVMEQAIGFERPELGDHLFRQPVAEILLFGIAAQVVEGQHGQHDFVIGWPIAWTLAEPRRRSNQ